MVASRPAERRIRSFPPGCVLENFVISSTLSCTTTHALWMFKCKYLVHIFCETYSSLVLCRLTSDKGYIFWVLGFTNSGDAVFVVSLATVVVSFLHIPGLCFGIPLLPDKKVRML